MKILRIKTFAEGEHSKKVRKVTDKVDTGLTIGTHGTVGAGIGYSLGGAKGAAIGAGAAGAGGGTAHLVSKYAEKHPNSKTAKEFEKNRDMIKVVEGDMSEEEFAKKYGKKK